MIWIIAVVAWAAVLVTVIDTVAKRRQRDHWRKQQEEALEHLRRIHRAPWN